MASLVQHGAGRYSFVANFIVYVWIEVRYAWAPGVTWCPHTTLQSPRQMQVQKLQLDCTVVKGHYTRAPRVIIVPSYIWQYT